MTWLPQALEVIRAGDCHAVDMQYDGVIYVSYAMSPGDNLYCARSYDGAKAWDPGAAPIASNVGWSSVDASGSTVVIAYYDWVNGKLMLARSVDGGDTWSIVEVDGGGAWVGNYCSAVLVGNDVFISYYNQTSGRAKVVRVNY